jgi:hypothetical protein
MRDGKRTAGTWAAILVATSVCLSLAAAESDEQEVPPGIGFIEGNWRGTMGEAVIEETWSPSEDGWHIGMFRMIRDGRPRLYEIIAIGPVEGRLTMYMRHFGSQFEAWEPVDEPLIFDLERLSGTEAVFRQRRADTTLTYALDAPDRLRIVLEKTRNGETTATTFIYERVK